MTEKDICLLIENDAWMMEVLRTVNRLHLPDWWVGAGFVRNTVWDYLHGFTGRTSLNDIDVIYFAEEDVSEETEKKFEQKLKRVMPQLNWSVKNQARMALVRRDGPYKNATDGLSRWVETATCIGVTLDATGKVVLTAPWGIDDLVSLLLRVAPAYEEKPEVFFQRIKNKRWLEFWPKLRVVTS